ncbi:YbjQ family protein [Brevibacillus dissolubilis]|uniref:YbjQ family protein n=1 Tax=Brevibacillus dissolubilis TaxID=1844116 RepID=UPI0011169482|nr:heavy metal-binding domain-containing protein [Brevibacillus dissolubilis]
MLITTTETLQGKNILQYIGVVSGHGVVETGVKPSDGGFFTDRSTSIEIKLEEARVEAMQRILKMADSLPHVNAIIGLRLDFQYGDGYASCSATGTAVRIQE